MPPWPSSRATWVRPSAAPYQSAAISDVTRAAVWAGSSPAAFHGFSSVLQYGL